MFRSNLLNRGGNRWDTRSLLTLAIVATLLMGGCPLLLPADGAGASTDNPGRSTPSSGSAGSTAGSAGTAVGATVGSAGQSSSEPVACSRPLYEDTWKAEILRLVNAERARRGVGALTWSAALEAEATRYACELISDDFFAHVNPRTGSTLASRARAAGYEYWIVGENLAAGQTDPASVVSDWMNSPEHRENILNPAFTEMGVGIRTGGDYGIYWVQELGRPRPAGPYLAPS